MGGGRRVREESGEGEWGERREEWEKVREESREGEEGSPSSGVVLLASPVYESRKGLRLKAYNLCFSSGISLELIRFKCDTQFQDSKKSYAEAQAVARAELVSWPSCSHEALLLLVTTRDQITAAIHEAGIQFHARVRRQLHQIFLPFASIFLLCALY